MNRSRSQHSWPGIVAVMAVSVFIFAFDWAAADEDTGWVSLFDGTNLDHWEEVGKPSIRSWTIDHGELTPTTAGGWLSTKKTFDDFELSLEFMLPPGGNSGVFLRAPRNGRTSRMGMEIQLLDDHAAKYRNLKPWQLCGSLYHVEPARPGAAGRANQWQTLSIRLCGRELTVQLNGKEVVHTRLDRYPQLEAEHPGLKRASGYIGLQNYGGSPVRFRKIRVRTLHENCQ